MQNKGENEYRNSNCAPTIQKVATHCGYKAEQSRTRVQGTSWKQSWYTSNLVQGEASKVTEIYGQLYMVTKKCYSDWYINLRGTLGKPLLSLQKKMQGYPEKNSLPMKKPQKRVFFYQIMRVVFRS